MSTLTTLCITSTTHTICQSLSCNIKSSFRRLSIMCRSIACTKLPLLRCSSRLVKRSLDNKDLTLKANAKDLTLKLPRPRTQNLSSRTPQGQGTRPRTTTLGKRGPQIHLLLQTHNLVKLSSALKCLSRWAAERQGKIIQEGNRGVDFSLDGHRSSAEGVDGDGVWGGGKWGVPLPTGGGPPHRGWDLGRGSPEFFFNFLYQNGELCNICILDSN